QSGRPSPGWPKPISRDGFRSLGPPLALDVNGDGRSEVVALDAAGVLGALDVVAPDRAVPDSLKLGEQISGRFETLYAYSIGVPPGSPVATSWPMVGG